MTQTEKELITEAVEPAANGMITKGELIAEFEDITEGKFEDQAG